jgi:cell division protein FtsZ
VNVDFADVKTVMSNMGRALMGTGCAKGQGRARLAAEMAVSSPLLDDISVEGATGVLINIVGGPDMRMREIEEAATLVQEQAHEDANIIFGATIDETMGDAIKVTVIATGFDQPVAEVPAQLAQTSSRPLSSLASPQMQARPMATQQPAPARNAPSAAPPPSRQAREDLSFPTRRAPAQQPAPAAGAAGGTRERATFVPPLDSEWDTPAFQRRNQ